MVGARGPGGHRRRRLAPRPARPPRPRDPSRALRRRAAHRPARGGVHRPRLGSTPTGTNLLGVVKHLAGVEAGYFGACLGRTWPEPMASWTEDAEPNADMWATADESPEEVLDLYRRVTA
ncbi:DUF664 domain-containing protein [Oryzobacter sp. R7]|uniref:mycothiol transferase n=1 Tax=Oryzobacter faecalis TaxID=3388656 RepID=UPI00398D40E2